MTPTVTAALRTRARAEVRCEVALMQYRDARRAWFLGRRWRRGYRSDAELLSAAGIRRTRWSTLHDLLAADDMNAWTLVPEGRTDTYQDGVITHTRTYGIMPR